MTSDSAPLHPPQSTRLDDAQFQLLVAPHRRSLEAHCYRMLGSLSDAEDLVQETLLRAWQGLEHFEGRAAFRSWLYKIATNACLDALARRPRRALVLDPGVPADPDQPLLPARRDPIWLEPSPDWVWQEPPLGPEAQIMRRESVTLAFMVALHDLPPLQRAVLLLRDVLGLSAAESAEMLDTSVPAITSALQRARASLPQREPGAGSSRQEWSAQQHADQEALLGRYMQAWAAGDAAALVSLVREDAMVSMPPMPAWYRGRVAIGRFLGRMLARIGPSRLLPTSAAGGPACAVYERAAGSIGFRASALVVLVTDAHQIAEFHAFIMPQLFPRFGLPTEL